MKAMDAKIALVASAGESDGQVGSEGVFNALEFWNSLRLSEEHDWHAFLLDLKCKDINTSGELSRPAVSVTSTFNLDDGLTEEVYNLFSLFESDASIKRVEEKLSGAISVGELLHSSTLQVEMPCDRSMFTTELLSTSECEYMLLNALLCAHPRLTNRKISRLSSANRNEVFQPLSTSFVEKCGSGSNATATSSIPSVSNSYTRNRTLNSSSSTENMGNPFSPQTPDAYAKYQRRRRNSSDRDSLVFDPTATRSTTEKTRRTSGSTSDPRRKQLTTKTLVDYVRRAFRLPTTGSFGTDNATTSASDSEMRPAESVKRSERSRMYRSTSIASHANSYNSRLVEELYASYTSEKAYLKQLIENLDGRFKQLDGESSDSQQISAILEHESSRNIESAGAKSNNWNVSGRFSQRDREVDDGFLQALVVNSKRFYFHLLHTFIAFELSHWPDQSPMSGQGLSTMSNAAGSADSDLFDLTPTADGAVILEECRARLHITEDFHQLAILGSLAKCYDLSNCAAYFRCASSVIDKLMLSASQLPSDASLEREILLNASSLLVDRMLYDLRHHINRFSQLLADEQSCRGWLELLQLSLSLKLTLESEEFTEVNLRQTVADAVKYYCADRPRKLLESVQRRLEDKASVLFLCATVLVKEVEMLRECGAVDAFESKCNIELAKELAQSYFNQCVESAAAIIGSFVNNETGKHVRSCSEHLTLVFLIKRLERVDWKLHLDAPDTRSYRALVENVAKLWEQTLLFVLREAGEIQTRALSRESYCKTFDIGAMSCSVYLLNFLTLLLRFTHFYFSSTAVIFADPPASSGSPASGSITSGFEGVCSSGYQTDLSVGRQPHRKRYSEPQRKAPSASSSASASATTSSQLRFEYFRRIYSLVLPFSFNSAFFEFADQPAARVALAFGQRYAVLRQLFISHCVDNYKSLAKQQLNQRASDLSSSMPTAAGSTEAYLCLLNLMKRIRVVMLGDASLGATEDFLLKFTRSYCSRLNDFYILAEIVKSGGLDDLVATLDVANDDDVFNLEKQSCVTCRVPFDVDEDARNQLLAEDALLQRNFNRLESECAFCFASRQIKATLVHVCDGFIHLACQTATVYNLKALLGVFSCSYSQFLRCTKQNQLMTSEKIQQLLVSEVQLVARSAEDEALFPAAFFFSELARFCFSRLITANAQRVLHETFKVMMAHLRANYEAFLRMKLESKSQKAHAAYLRFHAQHLILASRQYALGIDDCTLQQLSRLSCLLELHGLTAEQLVFVWCLLEDHKPSVDADRVAGIDFRKCLSTLFGLGFRGYNELVNRFTTDFAKSSLANRTGEFIASGMRSIDVLLVLWLRRVYKHEERLAASLQENAQTHRLKEAERYFSSEQRRGNLESAVSQQLDSLWNDLCTSGAPRPELEQYVQRLAMKRTA